MSTLRLASCDCFAPDPFGGNIAFLVDGGADLTDAQMSRIAREYGVPATCFIQGVDARGVAARFFSPGAELPMCGHGTTATFRPDLPIEIVAADFTHLVVPMRALDDLLALEPDFAGLACLCHQNGIGTVISAGRRTHATTPVSGTAATSARRPASTKRPLSAPATGPLAAYLARHGVIAGNGLHSLEAEQRLAVAHPGRVHLEVEAPDTRARAIRVGDMATSMITGSIPRPS